MDVKEVQKQLGLRLRQLRLAKNLRQEDLEKWDFSYRYYGMIERGLINPSLDTLFRLCKIFDVSLYELFRFLDIEIVQYLVENDVAPVNTHSVWLLCSPF